MTCNDTLLVQEMQKSPDAPKDKALLDHLATCMRCQQRMSELAASDDWWSEASNMLIDDGDNGPETQSILVALDTNGSNVSIGDASIEGDWSVDCDPVSLEFLGTPSHPEMLGRLGRYEVERLIGAGGMGIVLKAFDTELHRVVAIKVLAPHLAHSGAARRRFAREAQAAAAVVQDNVVPIHNVETDEDVPYLVMQYVPGASLQSRVDQNGPLTVDETLRIGAQIAEGLSAAHQQGLIHRDVKPANILLEQDVDRVLISDFGLARAVDDASLTRSGIVAGTPHYMSPEQSRGVGIDCRSDLFGLGSVLYFMLTGRPPFRADGAMAVLNRICHDSHRPVCQINDGVPHEVSRLVDRLLEKDPERRIPTAESASRELTGLLTKWRSPGGRRLMHRSGWWTSLRRIPVKRVGTLSLATVLLVFLVAFGLFRLVTSNRRQQTPTATTLPSSSEAGTVDVHAENALGQTTEFTPETPVETEFDPAMPPEADERQHPEFNISRIPDTELASMNADELHWMTWPEFTLEIETTANQIHALEQAWQLHPSPPNNEDEWLNELRMLNHDTKRRIDSEFLNGD